MKAKLVTYVILATLGLVIVSIITLSALAAENNADRTLDWQREQLGVDVSHILTDKELKMLEIANCQPSGDQVWIHE